MSLKILYSMPKVGTSLYGAAEQFFWSHFHYDSKFYMHFNLFKTAPEFGTCYTNIFLALLSAKYFMTSSKFFTIKLFGFNAKKSQIYQHFLANYNFMLVFISFNLLKDLAQNATNTLILNKIRIAARRLANISPYSFYKREEIKHSFGYSVLRQKLQVCIS